MGKKASKNELVVMNDSSSNAANLPDVFLIENRTKPMQVFDTSVWAEKDTNLDDVVLSGYISEMHKNGLQPEDIARALDLPVIQIRRKLNVIANSFLGDVNTDIKAERRIEIDRLIMQQLNNTNKRYEEELNSSTPDLKLINALAGNLTKLLQMRTTVWGLNSKEPESKGKGKPQVIKQNNMIINTPDNQQVKDTISAMNKLGDFIIGIHNGNERS